MKKEVVKFCTFLLILLIIYLILSRPNFEYFTQPAPPTCTLADGVSCSELSGKVNCLACESKGCGWCTSKDDNGVMKSYCLNSDNGNRPAECNDGWETGDSYTSGTCETMPYGCCPNGTLPRADQYGSNCMDNTPGCNQTTLGCCSDGTTARTDAQGSNCFTPGGCSGTQYGCCPDGTTAKADSAGTNCPGYVPPAGCKGTQYGCCPDGTTTKQNPQGTNCPGYVPPPPPPPNPPPTPPSGGCNSSPYGCCPDGVTPRNYNGSNCPNKPPPPPPSSGCQKPQNCCCPRCVTASNYNCNNYSGIPSSGGVYC